MLLTFDTQKFMETGLGLYDYMILVMYQKENNWLARELSENLSITERTCYAKRKWLVECGFLEQKGVRFYLTLKTKMLIAA